ncbi:Protein of unknown function [Nonomuraea solani]|uniref:DUF3592 domain-containing protein n=1 Tax=Nonomuraea solani TaxID=1144553 RepID=A0A1H6EYT0_9ACTN|nr:DUF3592 domain-containing protein [Nonomuraea solani]SEH02116.1 Protein of unknown function [Nonomuraea solani]
MGALNSIELIVVLVGLLGLALVMAGIRRTVRERRFLRHAVRAPAKVIGRRPRTEAGGVQRWLTSLRFTTADGSEITADSRITYPRPSHELGAQVRVIYDPANPREVRIDDGVRGRLRALAGPLLIGMGALYALGAVVVFLTIH